MNGKYIILVMISNWWVGDRENVV